MKSLKSFLLTTLVFLTGFLAIGHSQQVITNGIINSTAGKSTSLSGNVNDIATITGSGAINLTGSSSFNLINLSIFGSNAPLTVSSTLTYDPTISLSNVVGITSASAAIWNYEVSQITAGHRPTIYLFGDSLTMGSSYGSKVTSLMNRWWNTFGYGGPGYMEFQGGLDSPPFQLYSGTALANVSATDNPFADGWGAWTSPQTTGTGSFSLNGCGVYQTAGTGQTWYGQYPGQAFTEATLFYAFGAGGGTVTFGNPITGITTSVSSATSSTVVQTLILKDGWAGTRNDNAIAATVTGAVALFGAYMEMPTGGIIAVGGEGGQTAATFAQLNQASRAVYAKFFNPVAEFVMLGQNDGANGQTSASFASSMQTLLGTDRTALPLVPLVLEVETVNNNQMTTNTGNYQPAYAALATSYSGTQLFWNTILGDAPSYINTVDNVHPNTQGVALLGEAIANYAGAGTVNANVGNWPWVSLDYLHGANLIANTASDSAFTGTMTNWASYAGGTVTVSGAGYAVMSPANTTGAGTQLASTYFGGTLTAGSTYLLSWTVNSPSTGTNGAFYTGGGASGTTYVQLNAYPNGGGGGTAGPGNYRVMFTPTGSISSLVYSMAPGGSPSTQSQSVTNVLLQKVGSNGQFVGGHATIDGFKVYATQDVTLSSAIEGTVTQVTASNSTLLVTNTTSTPSIGLNLANANTWTAAQTITVASGTALTLNGSGTASGETISLSSTNSNSPGISLYAGELAPDGILSAISVGRSITGGATFFDVFHDFTSFNAAGAGGFASYDSEPTITGSAALNHYAGFQARGNYSNSATIGQWADFVSDPVLNTGTISNLYGLHVYAPTINGGSITNHYAIGVDAFPLSATGSNYAIYSPGSASSLFGGVVTVGSLAFGTSSAFGTTIIGNSAISTWTNSSNDTAVGYFALTSETGGRDTAVGSQALFFVTTGSNDTALGNQTGYGITTGSYNLILGSNVQGLAGGLTNNIILSNGSSTSAYQAQFNGSSWSLSGGLSTPTLSTGAATHSGLLTVSVSSGTALTLNGNEVFSGSLSGPSASLSNTLWVPLIQLGQGGSTGNLVFTGSISGPTISLSGALDAATLSTSSTAYHGGLLTAQAGVFTTFVSIPDNLSGTPGQNTQLFLNGYTSANSYSSGIGINGGASDAMEFDASYFVGGATAFAFYKNNTTATPSFLMGLSGTGLLSVAGGAAVSSGAVATTQLTVSNTNTSTLLHLGEFQGVAYIAHNYFYNGTQNSDSAGTSSSQIQLGGGSISLTTAAASATPSSMVGASLVGTTLATDIFSIFGTTAATGTTSGAFQLPGIGMGSGAIYAASETLSGNMSLSGPITMGQSNIYTGGDNTGVFFGANGVFNIGIGRASGLVSIYTNSGTPTVTFSTTGVPTFPGTITGTLSATGSGTFSSGLLEVQHSTSGFNQILLDNETTTGANTIWLTEDNVGSNYSYIQRNGSTSAGTPRLTIFGNAGGGDWEFKNGGVGIGTATPSTALQVVGTISSSNLIVTGASTHSGLLTAAAGFTETGTATISGQTFINTYSLGTIGIMGTQSSLVLGSPVTVTTAYGISPNGSGGLDIMANQSGQQIRFWAGGSNSSPIESMTLSGTAATIQSGLTFTTLNTTDATSTVAASVTLVGGMGVGKSLIVGGVVTASSIGFTTTNNSAIGTGALASNTTGIWNTAVGFNALLTATNSNYNTAVGGTALTALTTGNENDAYGFDAMQAEKTGTNNAAFGFESMITDTNSSANIAIGTQALYNMNNSGGRNVAIGVSAGYGLTTGATNIFIGGTSGGLGVASGVTTGSNNILIGSGIQGLAAGLTGNIILSNGTSSNSYQAVYNGSSWSLSGGIATGTMSAVSTTTLGSSAGTATGLVEYGGDGGTGTTMVKFLGSGGGIGMIIDGAGDVGIRENYAPNVALSVSGSAAITGNSNLTTVSVSSLSSSGTVRFGTSLVQISTGYGVDSGGNASWLSGTMNNLTNTGATTLSGLLTGTATYLVGTNTTSGLLNYQLIASDPRLKDISEGPTYGLSQLVDAVDHGLVISYSWKPGIADGQPGLHFGYNAKVAQEYAPNTIASDSSPQHILVPDTNAQLAWDKQSIYDLNKKVDSLPISQVNNSHPDWITRSLSFAALLIAIAAYFKKKK